MSNSNPTRDEFAALLEESFSDGHSGEGQVVRGTITAIEKDMAIIDVGLKVEGRVPLKEFGAKAKDGQLKVGDTVEVIVVSRRTVLEESRAEQRSEIVQNLEEGQVVEGVVKNITDYGAFVDLGGIDGLLHVTDMAWRRVNHPSEILNIGQQVKVQIIRINQETHRISLGMKQLESDPWDGIQAKYPEGKKISGTVTNITDYGAFVELEPGIEGLIHISEMSWTKKNVH